MDTDFKSVGNTSDECNSYFHQFWQSYYLDLLDKTKSLRTTHCWQTGSNWDDLHFFQVLLTHIQKRTSTSSWLRPQNAASQLGSSKTKSFRPTTSRILSLGQNRKISLYGKAWAELSPGSVFKCTKFGKLFMSCSNSLEQNSIQSTSNWLTVYEENGDFCCWICSPTVVVKELLKC